MDFTLSIGPLLLALTVFSEHASTLVQFVLVVVVLLLAVTCHNYRNLSLEMIWHSNMNAADYIGW